MRGETAAERLARLKLAYGGAWRIEKAGNDAGPAGGPLYLAERRGGDCRRIVAYSPGELEDELVRAANEA
jgi:hypothetical protein